MSRMEAEKLAIDSALRYERNKERQKIRKEVEKIRAANTWKPETESDDYEGCMHEGYDTACRDILTFLGEHD